MDNNDKENLSSLLDETQRLSKEIERLRKSSEELRNRIAEMERKRAARINKAEWSNPREFTRGGETGQTRFRLWPGLFQGTAVLEGADGPIQH